MSTKYDISELVEQFSYEDLSKEDRAHVDQEIGQEIYGEMYDAIHLFQAVDSDIQPRLQNYLWKIRRQLGGSKCFCIRYPFMLSCYSVELVQ